MLKRVDDRRRAFRWRRAHGRLVLPRFHVDDVSLPALLVSLGRLSDDQVDDRDAIREAVIKLLDDLAVGIIEARR